MGHADGMTAAERYEMVQEAWQKAPQASERKLNAAMKYDYIRRHLPNVELSVNLDHATDRDVSTALIHKLNSQIDTSTLDDNQLRGLLDEAILILRDRPDLQMDPKRRADDADAQRRRIHKRRAERLNMNKSPEVHELDQIEDRDERIAAKRKARMKRNERRQPGSVEDSARQYFPELDHRERINERRAQRMNMKKSPR